MRALIAALLLLVATPAAAECVKHEHFVVALSHIYGHAPHIHIAFEHPSMASTLTAWLPRQGGVDAFEGSFDADSCMIGRPKVIDADEAAQRLAGQSAAQLMAPKNDI
jgi:hypothetical protein